MPISSNPPVVTVSQVNRLVAQLLSGDRRLQCLLVRGEISTFTRAASGHLYFTLTDGANVIKGVMWASTARGLSFQPKRGDRVVCRGKIDVYEVKGEYQLQCSEMSTDGVGDEEQALLRLKAQLQAEGMFDPARKRPLPKYPKRVGIVASKTGAAVQDILTELRLYPYVSVTVFDARAEGEGAPESIAGAIRRAQNTDADVLIIGRGGGSTENLSAYNTEIVARAVNASRIPTISAVGHAINRSISEMVADRCEETPSYAVKAAMSGYSTLAAEISAYERRINELAEQQVERAYRRIAAAVNSNIIIAERALAATAENIRLRSPQKRVSAAESELALCFEKIERSIDKKLDRAENALNVNSERISRSTSAKLDKAERALCSAAEVIDVLNPMRILVRGYSVAYKDGKVVSDSSKLSVGDRLSVRLARGRAEATVTNTTEG